MDTEISFHNKTDVKIQAQVFAGRALSSTCVVEAGGYGLLSAQSLPFDIFFKNATSGWEHARKLNSRATAFALNHTDGRYKLHESNKSSVGAGGEKADLDVNRSAK